MTFAQFEQSTELGRPVELYIFTYQGGTFRYTTDARNVVLASITYQQIPGLSRSAIEDTGDVSKSSISITCPEDFPMAKLFEVYPPSDVVELEIRRFHRDDPTDIVTQWIGRVLNATWSVGYATLMAESLQTRLKQPGLRRIYAKNCPHVLYGPDCRAGQIAFETVATLNGMAANGFIVTAPEFALFSDGYFAGGKMAFDVGDGNIERRGIREHNADAITLTHPITQLLPTSTISAWPGCNRTLDHCLNKFANIENYGGFPYMREKNPFGQNSVY